MKRLMLYLILSLLLAAPVLSETSVWVAKTDSSLTYIGGTIHLLRESDHPFPPEFDQAYNASEIIVFEASFKELSSAETQQAIMAKAVYSDGRTLDKVLSPEAYEKLDKYCIENGLPLASMTQFKPSMIVLTLLGIELQKLNVSSEGVDIFYNAKATADEKTIESLETVEEQIDVITSLGEGNESDFILYNIDDLKRMGGVFDTLVTSWKKGDVEILEDIFLKEMKQRFPKLFKLLLVDRNMKWLPGIEKYILSPETEFVLVGTAHLVGEEGVIAQLKKLGYKVEKLE